MHYPKTLILCLLPSFFMVSLASPEPELREDSTLSIHEGQIYNYLSQQMKDTSLGKVKNLANTVAKLSHQYQFAPGLILSIIKVESNFRAWAVSSQGALGLMQIMPETGLWLAGRYSLYWKGAVSLLDEETNLHYGVRYLAYLREKYNGDIKKMLLAYNRGPAKLDQDLEQNKKIEISYYNKVIHHTL